jgi:ABC-2 type transport system ATP-binding protein
MLRASGLSKNYGMHRGAFGVSLEVGSGEIVGFIGPNGAGKTTTIRMLMGFVKPNKGEVRLFGKQIQSEADMLDAKQHIGFLPSETEYYKSFTPRKMFRYAAQLVGRNGADFQLALELSAELEVELDTPIKKLSTGNQRKVGVVLALMHNPKLVVLDEPTSGLDPLVQRKVLKLLERVKQAGGGVFLSSHILAEVEQVCDRILMIKDGEIVISGNTWDILESASKKFRIPDPDNQHKQALEKLQGVEKTIDIGNETMLYTKDTEPVIAYLYKHKIFNYYLERPTLEEMFLEKYE